MGSEVLPYSAKLSSFHTANHDNNPFTVYVITVRKGNAQWQVFRRYKEWEELRARLQHRCGGAPPMPGKMLFGRMRPEVIETRVLGLNHFLQMVLSSPLYAASEDVMEFLEYEKNMPPPGLDLVLDPHDAPDTAAPEGSVEATRQAQLKRLVDAASQAFIPVSQEVPALDAAYLAERAAAYTSSLRPSAGPSAGTSLPLKPTQSTPPPPPSAGGLEAALERMLLKPPTAAADAALARSTASAAAGGLADVAVRGKHEVLVTVG